MEELEFKGTKGEWKCKSDCDYSDTYILNPTPTYEESYYNAKLIAAAPTLLHRLNSLILSVKSHPDYVFGENGDEWHDLISLSEEAINKALK